MNEKRNHFWKKLKRPFFVLAPMDDVTDSVFRRVIIRSGRPEVFFSEFVNVEGLLSSGRRRLMPKLFFTKAEKPLIAQIWGRDPDKFHQIASEIAEMGYDGVDINLGCPVKTVVKSGCGAAQIENPELVKEIIKAVKKGAAGKIAVSVKTRLGLKKQKTEEWLGFLLAQDLDAITVHARTAAEMSRVPARWEEIAKVARLRDRISPHTVIIGNGDVLSLEDGKRRVAETGCDGVMVGRGIFANPWLFTGRNADSFTPADRLELLSYHLDIFQKTWGEEKSYHILKKYFKIYVQGFPGASDLRTLLMETKSFNNVLNVISGFQARMHAASY